MYVMKQAEERSLVPYKSNGVCSAVEPNNATRLSGKRDSVLECAKRTITVREMKREKEICVTRKIGKRKGEITVQAKCDESANRRDPTA